MSWGAHFQRMLTTTTFVNPPEQGWIRPTPGCVLGLAATKPVRYVATLLAEANRVYQAKLAERRDNGDATEYPRITVEHQMFGDNFATVHYNDYDQAGRVDILVGRGGHIVLLNNIITSWVDPERETKFRRKR